MATVLSWRLKVLRAGSRAQSGTGTQELRLSYGRKLPRLTDPIVDMLLNKPLTKQ